MKLAGAQGLPRIRNLKGLEEVIKALREITNAAEEIVETVEETVLKPVVEPVKETINEVFLKEYLYNFRNPLQMELKELEDEIKKAMGVEGDLREYLREFFKNSGSGDRKSDK